jgi:hypothetical protein
LAAMSFGTGSLSAGSVRLLSTHRTETPNVFVGFADDPRLVELVFVLFVFDLVIIVVVGISRWWRGACDGENLLDATCPLLLQASVKLYGIGGHVVLLLIFVFEGWARSGSSPSASAQYISASFSVMAAMP